VSETYNSNSLNLIFGAFLPTIFLPLSVLSPRGLFAMWWMADATLLSGALLLRVERLLAGLAAWHSWRAG
jgi:hypothetical protein